MKVKVLADRGFGDQALYELLKDQLVRFRGVVKVADEHGVTKTAAEWVPGNGRPRLLRRACVTSSRREVGAVVCVKAKGMKEPWCLATSLTDGTGRQNQLRSSLEECSNSSHRNASTPKARRRVI